ncbi:Tetratricopeptide repeat protein [Nannocystis exedens]|nr:Tetratricopeptide repeat protein [Nannocystis exedens]
MCSTWNVFAPRVEHVDTTSAGALRRAPLNAPERRSEVSVAPLRPDHIQEDEEVASRSTATCSMAPHLVGPEVVGPQRKANRSAGDAAALPRTLHGDQALGVKLRVSHRQAGDEVEGASFVRSSRPAQAIFEELLALRRDIYGEGHPNNAFSLSDLGNVATLRGDFDTAEKHQRAALTILRAALPPRHERLAYPLSALADIAAQRGDFGAALDAFDEARAIWEHNFGPRSTRVAAMLERLASVQLVRGELGLAEQHATRALVIWSSAQSPDPQGTVLAHLALAQIELARDDYAAARDHTDKALPLSISVLGEDNLYTAVSRAMRAVALAGLGDLSGAEREADAAVASIERNYGAGSLWMSEVLTPRARVRQLQGRFDDARRDLEGSLALLDPRNAPIQRAHAEFQLAQVLWDSRADRAKARTLAVSAQTLFRQAGAKHYRAEIDAWLERHPG